MAWIRLHVVRAAVLWTGVTLLAGMLVAAEAAWSLVNAQQACFFAYPAVACPGGDDPAVARLTFALVGVPVIWGLGVGVLALARRPR